MKKCIVGKYNNNRIVIWSTIAMVSLTIIWLMNAVIDTPIMDEWKFLSSDVNKMFEGTMSFSDFWGTGIHRAFLASILTYINVKYLSYNTLLFTYTGVIFMFISAFVIYKVYKRSVTDSPNNIKKQILFLPVILTLFCFNQWEILTMQTSLTFMLRICVYLLIFSILDKWLINNTKSKYLFEFILFVCVSIVGVSQAYWPAMCGVIIISILFSSFINRKSAARKDYKRLLIIILGIILFIGLYIVISMRGFVQNSEFDSIEKKSLFSLIFSPTLVKGVLLMLGATLRPNYDKYIFNNNINDYILIGLVVLILLLAALFIYFKGKMYKKTLFPLMMISYGLISILFIFCGRVQRFGVDYLISSRYTCETILIIAGVVMIFAIKLNNIVFKNKYLKTTLCYVLILIPTVCVIYSNRSELRVAKFRREYRVNILNTMLNIEDASDEELSTFQVASPDVARNAVSNMKKYKLGVFKYTANNEPGTNFTNAKGIKGIYADKWATNSASFKIKTGKEGALYIKGLYPKSITGNETLDISINGKKVNTTKIEDNVFEIIIPTDSNAVIKVDIKSSFSYVNEPDVREISFLIQDIYAK